jgi:DNA-binding winged helix-turn-helix (wHTH) protein/TolB-like protein/cytochrome c-type biogenesis protein CcmH/NrfG
VHADVLNGSSEVATPERVTRHRIRIGEWRVDGTLNELSRAGRTLRIEPKAMEVLMALADRPGEVVSREALLALVWPGMVVGDDALTQSIIKLRKALGDTARSPAYIETISKRGYRLIAPVAADAAGGTGGSAPRRRGLRFAIGALVVLAAAVALVDLRDSRPLPAGGVPGAPGEEAAEAAPVGVAVVPFETVGAGVEQAYLARGIGSDLMTDLGRLSGLTVIGASATGSTPGARYLVTGSIQRDGATLRVNVRLVDARSREQLWSRRFEQPAADLLAVQSEIARDLVRQLPARISAAERAQLAKRYTSSPEAYDLFLRAQALFLARGPEENQEARALYRKALDLDPQFARAYAGLAMTYAMEYRYRGAARSPDALARASELAETARTIDPDIPEVHWALGFIHAQARRYGEAIDSLQRAIALNRSYADAYALIGGIRTYMGNAGQTIPLLRTALRLRPDGGYLYFLVLGRAYLFEDDLDQALINLREALKRNPDDLETHVYLAAAFAAQGNRAAAEWEADEIRAREPRFSMRAWLETYPMTSAPYRERLLDLTSKLGL